MYLLKSKSSHEVRHAFDEFLTDHEEFLAHKKKVTWHTDNGGEFMSHDLDEFCNEFAIARSFSVPARVLGAGEVGGQVVELRR